MDSKNISALIVQGITDALNSAEENGKGDTLIAFYDFCRDLGKYYSYLDLLNKVDASIGTRIAATSEARYREVLDKAQNLVYRFRRAEIREKIYELESSEECAALDDVGDDRFWYKIEALEEEYEKLKNP